MRATLKKIGDSHGILIPPALLNSHKVGDDIEVRLEGSKIITKTLYIQLFFLKLEGPVHKKMTITLDEAVYDGLYRKVGKRRMSRFIENLVRPHVLDTALDKGYAAMAADEEREAEAREWCKALAGDLVDETR